MRVLLIGPNGRLGSAVRDALTARHELITASRSGGELDVDIRDPRSIAAMYGQVGGVDASPALPGARRTERSPS
jgi:dTDP-4-dehydrorhamnose reductase